MKEAVPSGSTPSCLLWRDEFNHDGVATGFVPPGGVAHKVGLRREGSPLGQHAGELVPGGSADKDRDVLPVSGQVEVAGTIAWREEYRHGAARRRVEGIGHVIIALDGALLCRCGVSGTELERNHLIAGEGGSTCDPQNGDGHRRIAGKRAGNALAQNSEGRFLGLSWQGRTFVNPKFYEGTVSASVGGNGAIPRGKLPPATCAAPVSRSMAEAARR